MNNTKEQKTKIGIIDADLLDNGTRHPNLALMKISGYYKQLGYEVSLIESYEENMDQFEKIFMSKVFSFTKVPSEILSLEKIEIGGTGFFGENAPDLSDEIEFHMPDYDLYKSYVEKKINEGHKRTRYADYLDYSIGFTTRGCFRKCEFCVNKKYSCAKRHSKVTDFLDETRPYIYLWDDNILAYPKWNEVLDELEQTNKQFQFRQGIDLRLMTDAKAERFINSKYQGDFIFAFDHLSEKDKIIDKIQLWKRHTSKVCKLYVLCAFDSQDEKDIEGTFERISILMKYGCLPYIMRFEKYKDSPFRSMYIEIARWCNQPQFFKKKSFREYCHANQLYKKDQSNECSAMKAMKEFERQFPEIAEKYFDLKYEEENIYSKQYGYGRKYSNKPGCSFCKRHNNCLDSLISDVNRKEELILKYLTKEIDVGCLSYRNAECTCDPEEVSELIANALISIPLEKIINLLKTSNNRESVTKENIPQISDLASSMYRLPRILEKQIDGLSYEDVGKLVGDGEKNAVADRKYGENQCKLATLIDLAIISKEDSKLKTRISPMGKVFLKLNVSDREKLLERLCLRIPIIQNALIRKDINESIDQDILVLSKSTQNRRKEGVRDILKFVQSE